MSPAVTNNEYGAMIGKKSRKKKKKKKKPHLQERNVLDHGTATGSGVHACSALNRV